MEQLDRLKLLINDETIKKIQKTKVLLIGIGGVGGYTFETLIRSGIENITIIDKDIIDKTNLNRQILALTSTINKSKVEVAKQRALDINDKINIQTIKQTLDETNIKQIKIEDYDYVIDACDTLNVKKEIIKICIQNKIKFISCMGTGNKMHPEKLEITDLNKTTYDPLAKALRKKIRNEKITGKIPVISSTEQPIKNQKIGSNSYVPATAGILITSWVINDIVGVK